MDEEICQLACKVANRVTLGMLYQETAGRKALVRQMVVDAADATCDLLDRVNPVELRDSYEQLQTTFAETRTWLVDDPQTWSGFLASQCDLMQAVNFHQKTIANLGDRLARWERSPVPFTEFARGLDGLASLASDHVTTLGQVFDKEAGGAIRYARLGERFANSVSGLAIVLVAIDQSINRGDPKDRNFAALANFGAMLTASSVNQLFESCCISRD